jgi:hypothetical protein
VAYCVDEAIWIFGSQIDSELDGMKKATRKESDEAFGRRKQQRLFQLLGIAPEQRFASVSKPTV